MAEIQDLGLVISTGHRNWAIGELAKNLLPAFTKSSIIEIPQSRRHVRSINGFIHWPKKSCYLFMHHSLAIKAWERKWIGSSTQYGIRYTHDSVNVEEKLDVFSNAKFITTENSVSKLQLSSKGFDENRIHVLPHPIEVNRFRFSLQEKERDVIFVSNFYERKNPELVLKVVKYCQDLQFTILGKDWENWSKFSELKELNNFEYKLFSYETYPQVLASHRVFCSLSTLEGGPVPLIESLTSGLKIVVTDTGHVRDVLSQIRDYNIVPIDAKADVVASALREAILDSSITNQSFERFDLKYYVETLDTLFN